MSSTENITSTHNYNRSKYLRYVVEIFDFKYVLYQLIKQQLVLRYRRTIMGYLWTLVNPLLMMSVTALVFSTIFQMDLKTFAIFLFTGMIPFNYFSTSVTQNSMAIISNEGLIKKIYIPKIVFPLGLSLGMFIDCILTSFTLFLIVIVVGGELTSALIFLPISFILLFIFSFGVSLVVSIFTIYFRDFQHILGVLMQALFFLSPILYKPESLKGSVAFLMVLNPIVPFIDLFRSPIYLGIYPSYDTVMKALLFSGISITIGLFVFIKNEQKIVHRL